MSTTADPIGHRIRQTAAASALRPRPDVELAAYGGARLFRGKRVLDIGTGDGRLAFGIARWAENVAGVDADPQQVSAARRNARRVRPSNVSFRVAPAQELPFRDGSFDVVVLSWSL